MMFYQRDFHLYYWENSLSLFLIQRYKHKKKLARPDWTRSSVCCQAGATAIRTENPIESKYTIV